MVKPAHIDGYDPDVTEACERVLVSLIRGLGPYKESIFLIGGLVPRYLVKDRPPKVPAHAGTADVDVVVALPILTEAEAYSTLEENLTRLGFSREKNAEGIKTSWRWRNTLENGIVVILEFLTEAEEGAGVTAKPLPTKGKVSALHIPYVSMVHDLHDTVEVEAELLGNGGKTTETVHHADLASFVCLKAFAFDDRNEPKDAHDLVYCLEYGATEDGELQKRFADALSGKHGEHVTKALLILKKRFCTDERTEGYKKDGPVAVSKFEASAGDNVDLLILRQRVVSDVVTGLIEPLGIGN
ncbi:MAG: hypothetical protein COA41_07110 [Sphingopyxis sp.]|nr:MAG: hypothetical protein COA41_07110 [Sphingopyxis sp.]